METSHSKKVSYVPKKVPVSRLNQLSTPKHRKNVSGATSFAHMAALAATANAEGVVSARSFRQASFSPPMTKPDLDTCNEELKPSQVSVRTAGASVAVPTVSTAPVVKDLKTYEKKSLWRMPEKEIFQHVGKPNADQPSANTTLSDPARPKKVKCKDSLKKSMSGSRSGTTMTRRMLLKEKIGSFGMSTIIKAIGDSTPPKLSSHEDEKWSKLAVPKHKNDAILTHEARSATKGRSNVGLLRAKQKYSSELSSDVESTSRIGSGMNAARNGTSDDRSVPPANSIESSLPNNTIQTKLGSETAPSGETSSWHTVRGKPSFTDISSVEIGGEAATTTNPAQVLSGGAHSFTKSIAVASHHGLASKYVTSGSQRSSLTLEQQSADTLQPTGSRADNYQQSNLKFEDENSHHIQHRTTTRISNSDGSSSKNQTEIVPRNRVDINTGSDEISLIGTAIASNTHLSPGAFSSGISCHTGDGAVDLGNNTSVAVEGAHTSSFSNESPRVPVGALDRTTARLMSGSISSPPQNAISIGQLMDRKSIGSVECVATASGVSPRASAGGAHVSNLRALLMKSQQPVNDSPGQPTPSAMELSVTTSPFIAVTASNKPNICGSPGGKNTPTAGASSSLIVTPSLYSSAMPLITQASRHATNASYFPRPVSASCVSYDSETGSGNNSPEKRLSASDPEAPWNMTRPSSSPAEISSVTSLVSSGDRTNESTIESKEIGGSLYDFYSRVSEQSGAQQEAVAGGGAMAGDNNAAAIQLRNARRRFRQSSQIAQTRKQSQSIGHLPLHQTAMRLAKAGEDVGKTSGGSSANYRSSPPKMRPNATPTSSHDNDDNDESATVCLNGSSEMRRSSSVGGLRSCLKKKSTLFSEYCEGVAIVRRVHFDTKEHVKFFETEASLESLNGISPSQRQPFSGKSLYVTSNAPRSVEEALDQGRQEREATARRGSEDSSSSEENEEGTGQLLTFQRDRFTVSDLMGVKKQSRF